ncbi:hypothetical protein DSCA_13640 [Desulfosarcina alkanivorans]|jgi:hypothetical protein|uniref:Uncharacterized protein n=1 Tax=Desulfosarcina alkanivorans TaxID=571177 RepID=A0A5K7YM51_9BACT|nr:hypothetical protein [Desulfosarcina alkanivorans]BBO67434.1 hypothetical protein DSCA_13640 [Desulfosarcina alkanivorans]
MINGFSIKPVYMSNAIHNAKTTANPDIAKPTGQRESIPNAPPPVNKSTIPSGPATFMTDNKINARGTSASGNCANNGNIIDIHI